MYKIVFWTECINFHTIQIFEYFGICNEVIIAYCERSFRGYVNITVENCKTIQISRADDYIRLINDTADYIHISNAFKISAQNRMLKDALKLIVKNKYNIISLFQEQYPYTGIKGILRMIKWYYVYHWGLGKTHKLIGYCGQKAYKSLKKAGIKEEKLIDFIYTPWYSNSIPIRQSEIPTFLMVGQLVDRKKVLETIRVFKSLKENFIFKIIGDGVLKDELKKLIRNDTRIKYLGSMSPSQVQREYSTSDYLILSSIFDGWGCSVNEALTQGCKIIISDQCGASSLISNNFLLGQIFRSNNWDELKVILKESISKGPLSLETKSLIQSWSKKISPQNESIYLTEILSYLYADGLKPSAPWS